MVKPMRLTLGGWLKDSVHGVNARKCAQLQFDSKLLNIRHADSICVSNMLTYLKVAPKHLSDVDSSQHRLGCIQKPRRLSRSVSKIEQVICSRKRFGKRSNRACRSDNLSDRESVEQPRLQRDSSHESGDRVISFLFDARLQSDSFLLSRGFRSDCILPNLSCFSKHVLLLLSSFSEGLLFFLSYFSKRVLLCFGGPLEPALCNKCDRERENSKEGLRPRCCRRPPAEWLAYQLERRAVKGFSDIYFNHGQSFALMGV